MQYEKPKARVTIFEKENVGTLSDIVNESVVDTFVDPFGDDDVNPAAHGLW